MGKVKIWLAEQLVGALLYALTLGRRKGYAYLLKKADFWREIARRRWWRYKLKTILSQQDPDDDMLADAIARCGKYENAPAESHWLLRDGVYWPLEGSGYIRNAHGEYIRCT